MLDQENLNSHCKELDKFIQENMYLEKAGYKLRGEKEYELREKEEALKKFILDYKSKSRKPFIDVLNHIGKKLYQEKWDTDKSDLCKSALITKSYISQIKNEKTHKLNKYSILSIGFALNSKNLLLKNKLNMSPKNIMNELFLSRHEEFITINYYNPFDLVIIFCIEELANEECDIVDVDHFLKYQGLPYFSEILLKGFPTEDKKEKIGLMLDIIESFKIEQINQKYFTNDSDIKKYNEETYINNEIKDIKDYIIVKKKEYNQYFDENENNNINIDKEHLSTSVPVETIYLPEFKYHKEHYITKERNEGKNVV